MAVDLEMTGVTSAPWRESFDFDSSDVSYLKVKDSAGKFAVVQFGVCPFRWDSSQKSFIAHPHNFYIFPRQEVPGEGASYEFLCQTSSLDFLTKYQFDFNLCIQEGISYLSRGLEDEALRHLDVVYGDELHIVECDLRELRETGVIRIPDVLFTERLKNRISEWRDDLLLRRKCSSNFEKVLNNSSQKLQTIFFKMRPSLLFNGFSSHQLRLIQLVAEKHFKDLVYVRAKEGCTSVQHFIVYIESNDDRERLMKEVRDAYREEAETKIKDAVGFRHVIDLLSSEKKLIVGHNCFLDFAHIYSKFFGHLPSTAEEYASCLHKHFPYIIDTKLLLNANDALRPMMRKGSTSLSKAFNLLCPDIAFGGGGASLSLKPRVKVEVQVDEMRSSNWNSGAKHEAGYDAFMTGCIFSQACSHIGFDLELNPLFANLVSDEKLQKHMNLLYLSWACGDIIDLGTGKQIAESSYFSSLKRRYPKVNFSNMVLIWGFPSGLKAIEIKTVLAKVFGHVSITSIYDVDETAVLVQFSKENLVFDFLELKKTLETKNDPISVLHPLWKLLEGGNTHAATYEFYKGICRSPISEVLIANQVKAMGIKWKTEPVRSDQNLEINENKNLEDDIAGGREFSKLYRVINNLSKGDSLDDTIIDSSYCGETQVSR